MLLDKQNNNKAVAKRINQKSISKLKLDQIQGFKRI